MRTNDTEGNIFRQILSVLKTLKKKEKSVTLQHKKQCNFNTRSSKMTSLWKLLRFSDSIDWSGMQFYLDFLFD